MMKYETRTYLYCEEDTIYRGKDIQIIRNIYWEQAACIRLGNELSKDTKTEKAVKQGCIFPTGFISPDSKIILW